MPTIARGRVGNSNSTLRATRWTPRPSPGQTKKELRDSSLQSASDAGRQKAWSGSDSRRCGAQDYVLTTRSLLGILFAKFLKYLSSFLEKIFQELVENIIGSQCVNSVTILTWAWSSNPQKGSALGGRSSRRLFGGREGLLRLDCYNPLGVGEFR